MSSLHTPVMCEEVVKYLVTDNSASQTFLDLTLGDGGHTEALLKASKPAGRVVALDRDAEAIVRATKRLAKFGERVRLVQANYSACGSVVGEASVDGIVADLGVSSRQLESGARGFSFRAPGPLDMRMDDRSSSTAADLVNTASEQELEYWLREYGEERFARRVVRAIVEHRAAHLFAQTTELAEVVRRVVPRGKGGGKTIDAATRTFQALRIVVNAELRHLETMLQRAPSLLRPHGRFVVMSYHSLEDRLVKNHFRSLPERMPQFRVLTKKPLTPTAAEVRANPRGRSVKFRVLERVAV